MCLNQFLNVLGEKVLTKEGKKYGFGYFEKHNVPCKKLQLILSGHFFKIAIFQSSIGSHCRLLSSVGW